MKMLKAASYFAIPVGIISLLFCIYFSLYQVRHPYYFTIQTDQQLADHVHTKIAHYLNNNNLITQPAQAIYQFLQQKIPFIQSISLMYKPGHLVTISCSITPAHTLLLNNGKRLCITKSGLITLTDYFTEQQLSTLPIVNTADSAIIVGSYQKELNNFLSKLPNNYFEHYETLWLNKTAIIFKQRDNKPFINLILNNTVSLDKFQPILARLQQILATEKISDQQEWYIDLRFKGYLIISKRSKNNEKLSIT